MTVLKYPIAPLLLFLALSLALGSCTARKKASAPVKTTTGASDSLLSQSLSLDLGEQNLLEFDRPTSASDKIGIQYVKLVSESRCPKDVNCIWEGRVEVAVHLEVNGKKSLWRVLSIGAKASSTLEFEGYTVALKDVTPHPVASPKKEGESSTIHLSVYPTPTTPPALERETPDAH